MVSNLQNPYKVIEENPLDYSFVNRDGINYHLYFTPISNIYPDLLNTYSFSIEREGTKPHPIDLRIAATVVYILRRFFRNLFDRWFQLYNDGTLATVNAEVGQGDYELLLSIYFRKDNPNKPQLIKAFGDLLAKDCFEIVI